MMNKMLLPLLALGLLAGCGGGAEDDPTARCEAPVSAMVAPVVPASGPTMGIPPQPTRCASV